jgi:hypothetical protein
LCAPRPGVIKKTRGDVLAKDLFFSLSPSLSNPYLILKTNKEKIHKKNKGKQTRKSQRCNGISFS